MACRSPDAVPFVVVSSAAMLSVIEVCVMGENCEDCRSFLCYGRYFLDLELFNKFPYRGWPLAQSGMNFLAPLV